MNIKQFLLGCGGFLLLFGMLGYVLPDGKLLGANWFLTNGENVVHLIFGVLALAAAYVFDAKMQKTLVQIMAIVLVFFAVFGFMVRDVPPLNTFLVANLENPYDNILHLVLGIWGVYIGFVSREKVVI